MYSESGSAHTERQWLPRGLPKRDKNISQKQKRQAILDLWSHHPQIWSLGLQLSSLDGFSKKKIKEPMRELEMTKKALSVMKRDV